MDPIKNSMKRNWAADWMEDFRTNSADHYFMMFARTESWGNTGESWNEGTDTSARLARDTTNNTFGAWRDSIGAKRVRQIDAMHVIPRIDWKENVVYDEYDPDIELFRDTKPPYEDIEVQTNWPKKFYVFTNEYNVYECISNNSGLVSTVQPNGTSPNIITTSDNYRWKFLYKIPEDLYRFITEEYIPVRYIETLDASELNTDARLQWNVQQNAVDGRIDHIDLISNGTAFERTVPYSSQETRIGRVEIGTNDPRIDVPGTGITGGDVRAELRLRNDAGAFSAIDNYYNGYSVVIMTGAGSGQVRHITGYIAETRTLYLDRQWSDTLAATETSSHSTYSIVPKCTIRGDGHEAEAVIKLFPQEDLSNGDRNFQIVQRVDIVSGGYGYTTGTCDIYPRGKVIDAPSNDPQLKISIPPKKGHGWNPIYELGSDEIMIVVTFNQDEDGDFSVLNDYRTIGIIKNPTISAGGASGGGIHTGKLAGTEQPVTSILTVDAITGDGTALFTDQSFVSGDYIISDRSNTVAQVKKWTYDLTSKSFGFVTIHNINGDFIGTNADGSVTGEAINNFTLSSTGVWEFATGNSYATVRARAAYANDTDLTYKLYHEVAVQAVSGQSPLNDSTYPLDTKLVGEESETTGIVLEWSAGTNGTTGALKMISVDGDFKVGENIYDITKFLPDTDDDTYSLPSAPQVAQVSEIDIPELVKGSGEIVYIQNMRPVMRSFEQDEDIKVVLGF